MFKDDYDVNSLVLQNCNISNCPTKEECLIKMVNYTFIKFGF